MCLRANLDLRELECGLHSRVGHPVLSVFSLSFVLCPRELWVEGERHHYFSPRDIWAVQGGNISFLKHPHSSIQNSVWSWCGSSVVEEARPMYKTRNRQTTWTRPWVWLPATKYEGNFNQYGHVLPPWDIFNQLPDLPSSDSVFRVCRNQAKLPLGGRVCQVEYSQWSMPKNPSSNTGQWNKAMPVQTL